MTDSSHTTSVYYGENGKPMLASQQVRALALTDRYVTETRALLATTRSVESPS